MAKKEEMQVGGAPLTMGAVPARALSSARPVNIPAGRAAPPMPVGRAPLMRKKGGEVESKAEHKSEMKRMGKVESELKAHARKPASKAHAGLKTGGVVKKYAEGGSVSADGFRAMKKCSSW